MEWDNVKNVEWASNIPIPNVGQLNIGVGEMGHYDGVVDGQDFAVWR